MTDLSLLDHQSRLLGLVDEFLATKPTADQMLAMTSELVRATEHLLSASRAADGTPTDSNPAAVTYRVTFEDGRIGRRRDINPVIVNATDADELAEAVFRYAKPFLMSRDVEVSADLEAMSGTIYCGLHIGGKYTIETVDPDTHRELTS
jgi:hypothetical protein